MVHNHTFIFSYYIYISQRKDLLQLMIDAGDSETQEGLEKGEIIADSVGFMLAGYETTSTTLTFATYLLAANPEAQERLANEIHEYFEENSVSGVHMTFYGFVHARGSALQTAHKCFYANGTGLGYPRDWLMKECSCICLYIVQVEIHICQVVCCTFVSVLFCWYKHH